LSSDTVLSAAVGQGLVDNHVFMKEAEVEKTKDLTPEQLRDFYIFYI
jgi:glutamine synthetase